MKNPLSKPKFRPWILGGVSLSGTITGTFLFYEAVTKFYSAYTQNAPLIQFDTIATVIPGCIAGMIALAVVAYADWRYQFFPYRTKREREQYHQRLSRAAGRGMIACLIFAFALPFLVFNPLIEHYLLSAHDYVRCPNQIQLSYSWSTDVWVKESSWCFDKGFQDSFSDNARIRPLAYLEQLQAQKAASSTSH